MSKEREAEVTELLRNFVGQEALRLVTELLTLRRERHRDKLESLESAEVRGRSKECKDLLQLFS